MVAGNAAEPRGTVDPHLTPIEAKLQAALIEILLEGDLPDCRAGELRAHRQLDIVHRRAMVEH